MNFRHFYICEKNFMKKIVEIIIKKMDLLEDSKMPQEFYMILNFNFIMIYIIHEILIMLKNQLNYLKNSIFKCFLKEYNRVLFIYFF